MTRILAIDPGSTESGWVVIDADTRKPLAHGKDGNGLLLSTIRDRGLLIDVRLVAVEKVESYGMAVGAHVFATCTWAGRFIEAVDRNGYPHRQVPRRDVKLHHCGQARAKDANITQALVDRFAPGEPNKGKGTKAEPGFFYGFKADVWQAYALAVYVADSRVATGIEAQA